MAATSAVRAAGRRSRRLFDIFVADIPWTVSSKELKEYFSRFGSVQRCQLPFIQIERDVEQPLLDLYAATDIKCLSVKKAPETSVPIPDRDTGFHRRYCWIKFSTPAEVQNVLQKDPHILEGSKLTLKQQIRRRRSQRRNPSE